MCLTLEFVTAEVSAKESGGNLIAINNTLITFKIDFMFPIVL